MRKPGWIRQMAYQAGLAVFGLFTILPLLNMFRIAFDGSIKMAPTDFRLWPKVFTLNTMIQVWQHPSQDLSMLQLLKNSFLVSGGAALFSAALGLGLAFAFARLRFTGQRLSLIHI